MLDLESIRENNRSKINEPETLKKLMAQEFLVEGKIVVPAFVDEKNTCLNCVFKKSACGERMFDDLGSVIPDCEEEYPKPVIYLYK